MSTLPPLIADPAAADGRARYRLVQEAARALVEPLLPLLHEGAAEVAINDARPGVLGTVGNSHCTRFELFVRPLLLVAHWLNSLQHEPRPEQGATRRRVAAWFREALLLGTQPGGPLYWGPDANYYQLHVDMGLLPVAIHLARGDLWDPLTAAEKSQVAAWLGTSRGAAYVHANHYFMGVQILEFLGQEGFGHRVDRALIDLYFSRLESMYRADGWFEDGANQSYDYYNAYAFHYYGLWWARLYGHHDQIRAQRWRAWTKLFLRDYEHFFSASGEQAPFGRSIAYRFNAIAIFGLATLEGVGDLPLGRIRRLCLRNLDFFLQRPIFQEQGCLSIGWTDRFEPIGENYLKPGSPYWAAKGLSLLQLPPSHDFWTTAEAPMLSEKSDYARVINPAGLVVRSVGGTVEILNAGGQISESRVFMGVWKWSKTSYRTGVGYMVPPGGDLDWSPDSALTQQVSDGRTFGRHATHALQLDARFIHFIWNMGDRTGPVSTGVESFVAWNAGWLLQVHHCEIHQLSVLKLGGFSLAAKSPEALQLESSPPIATTILRAWADDGRGTGLQPLAGFARSEWECRLDDTAPRQHMVAPYHAVPIARTNAVRGHLLLAALTWSGSDRGEAQPWALQSSRAGNWVLAHPQLERWEISHAALPAL